MNQKKIEIEIEIEKENPRWEINKGFCYTKHTFIGVHQDHLTLRTVGEPIIIEEKYGKEWLYGSTLITERRGIFPTKFVKIIEGKGPTKEEFLSLNCHPIREFDPVILECENSLTHLSERVYSTRYERVKGKKIQTIFQIMDQLVKYRTEFLSKKTPKESLFAIKQRIVSNLDQINAIFSIKKQVRRENGDPAMIDYLGVCKAHELYLQNNHSDMISQTRVTGRITASNKLQMLLDFQFIITSMTEPTTVIFQLYSANDKTMISEGFSIEKIVAGGGMGSKMGSSDQQKKQLKTIFQDLNENEISSDLYLVAHVFRLGLFNKEEKKTKKKENWPVYRRPLGCAVHKIDKSFIQASTNEKQNLSLPIFFHPEETKFGKLHELIIKNDVNLLKESSCVGVNIEIKCYMGDYDHVIKTYPDYEGNKLQDIPPTIKPRFPETILPNYQRNDLYVTLNGCNMINAKKLKNLELRVTVRNRIESNGQQKQQEGKNTKDEPFRPKAISYGKAGETMDMYTSYVCSSKSDPKWNETLKINLNPQEYQNAELYFEIYSSQPNSSQIYSVGYLRLTKPDHSIIDQGEKKIDLYKWDTKLARRNTLFYLPNSKESKEKNSKVISFQNALTVTVNLCSTSLTQHERLVAFFDWRKNINNLNEVFQKLKYVNSSEKIKFIAKIFDTLFEILNEKSNENQVQERIFEEVLNVYNDIIKTKGYRSVLDYLLNEYYNVEKTNASIENQKHFSKVYLTFVKALTNVLKIEEGDKMRQVLQTMKGLELIFKLIGNSYEFNKKFNPNNNNNNNNNQNNNQRQRNIQNQIQTNSTSDEDFKEKFSKLMNLFSNFMSLTEPTWVKSAQNVALKFFKTLFTDLLKIFDLDLTANLLAKMIKSVNVEGRDLMRRDKLIWIKSIATGQLVEQTESREIIIKVIKEQINSNILIGETLNEICVSVINSLIIQTFQKSKKKNDLFQWTTQLLPFLHEIFRGLEYNDQLINALKEEQEKAIDEQQTNNKQELENLQKNTISKQEELKKKQDELESKNQSLIQDIKSKFRKQIEKKIVIESSLISSFLSLFHMTNSEHISILLNSYSERIEDQTILLEKIFNLFLNILTKKSQLILKIDDDQFETSGLLESTDLPMARFLILIETFKNISKLLTENFLGENFQFNIWRLFILSLLEFITLPELSTNKKYSSKADFIQDQYGDLREVAAIILDNCWYCLQDKIINFIPNEVEHFLKLLLLENKELVNYGFEFYFTLFLEEFAKKGEISGIEQGTVAMVGSIIDTENDETFINYFFKSFAKKFAKWRSIEVLGKEFLEQLKQLIQRSSKLKEFRGKQFEEEKSQVLIDIIEYLFKTQRYQMFARYCQLLCDLHVQNSNFTEAGLSLLKLVEILDWDSNSSTDNKNDNFKDNEKDNQTNKDENQKKFQTASKESLLKKAIDYLNKGKSWELAIEQIQYLKLYYADTYSYSKLNHYLSKESEFYKNIVTVDRFYATYFRVGYFGRGFEDEKYQGLKDQNFIYKGKELEQLSEFMDKLKIKFPKATYDSKDPNEEQRDGEGQYIQVCTVLPSSKAVIEGGKIKYDRSIPEKILKHKMEGKVNVFVYSQPFKKSTIKSSNEFADLWIRNIYMITEDYFPTTCRRLKVKESKTIEISPIQNGVNSIENKNEDLISIITKYQTETIQNTNPFSMALNGVIDAAVNGGVQMYVDAFFQQKYLVDNPENEHLVAKMKQLLTNQLYILNVGLRLHNRLCPDNFRPFHDKMKIQLETMNKKLESSLKNIQPDEVF
ncbi:dedicator of cytokinesis [Anaeramoeba flamelloides]|uniref:Dedicator of cytokinesis n=1 Tax=Anaeramoeba flamelloides TaxID=1746091 RepID=A0ABQ8XZZ4_9EUKA|nr:dedicator of cytokinesis [Anaeramoeba flamelloides]